MSRNSDPLTANEVLPPEISHRALLVKMVVVLIAGTVAGVVFFSAKAGFGVLIGGILAFANYYWQKRSLKAIFDKAIGGEPSRFLAVRYILRYVALGAALTIVYLTQTVPIVAVIFGMASFAIAVVIEGFTSIFSGSERQES
jgi:hypothetical protein